MTDDGPKVVRSGLSHRVTLDGVTVEVQIYRIETELKWMLAVANESGNSTVWDEVFPTDSAALAAFVTLVRKEGLAPFLDSDGPSTVH